MRPWVKEHWVPGILSKTQLQKLVEDEIIEGVEDFDSSAKFSSMDLHISDEGYRMKRGCIKPCGDHYLKILNDPTLAERLKIGLLIRICGLIEALGAFPCHDKARV